ncbi:MmyB family transcriptional regulator [Saccharopolyspora pogona]|uniref:MmyB family transcriptional regulator n=1 Tax=Saccharopolyspora pogona TaxID=333966 RepID=UPI001682D7A3|nr:hypothetical protein [Saccharopolyspora pogona]
MDKRELAAFRAPGGNRSPRTWACRSGRGVAPPACGARLRSADARYPDDPGIRALVAELRDASPGFAHLWESHQVHTPHQLPKTMNHLVVGPLELNCDVLVVPEQDQHLVIYTAEPGSPSDHAMQLLKVIGTQRMDVPT